MPKFFRGNSTPEFTNSLTADVDLVAFGLAIDAEPELLKDFLVEKGILVTKVECLTRKELLDAGTVRSKTMKVSVKASNVEQALKLETWPYRVKVRHYQAPQRSRPEREGWAQQAARPDGRQDENGSQGPQEQVSQVP